MDEVWKDIKGYEGIYQVSNLGRIKRVCRFVSGKHLREKILKGGIYPNGYHFVCLRKNGVNTNHLSHRLVANAFVNNSRGVSDVNHIDGDKLNNRADNLEWVTRSENLKHALKIGLIDNQCKIRRKVIIQNSKVTIEFESMKSCAEFFGFKKGWLQNKIRKHGLSFYYLGYRIVVESRGDIRIC